MHIPLAFEHTSKRQPALPAAVLPALVLGFMLAASVLVGGLSVNLARLRLPDVDEPQRPPPDRAAALPARETAKPLQDATRNPPNDPVLAAHDHAIRPATPLDPAWLIGLGLFTMDAAALGLFLAMRREIRRRRSAERQAQIGDRWLRLKIDAVEDHAFFSVDRNGLVMTWSGGAETMLGYTAAEILGRSLDQILQAPPEPPDPAASDAGHHPTPPADKAFTHDQGATNATAAQPPQDNPQPAELPALAVSRAVGQWAEETGCRRKDGTGFDAVVVLSAILEPDNVLMGHAVMIHDLTSQRRMQRRLRVMERMDAIGQVTSGVTHDFNNLLQAQIISLELLQERLDPTGVERELSDVALNAAEQAARLTDQLLAFSRQQMLRPTRVDLAELLISVVSLAQHTAGPNIRLAPVVARDLPAILADPALLQTALLNLIINARDAIGGFGAITVHAYPADAETAPPAGFASASGFVVLVVTDTGHGMDAATAERACEPFFTTKGANGSGLGLSMVQGFARQTGGDIRIVSAPNRGTSVELWLPCAPPTDDVASGQAPRPPARAGHILLVDDAPDVLLVLAAFLRGAGLTVTQAGNAREALWHLQRGAIFTVLVTDFLMPGMDGMDLAQQARLLRPDLPVLIITGFVHSKRLGELAPGIALLRKPFRKEDLLAAVGTLLPEAVALSNRPEGRRSDDPTNDTDRIA